MFDLRYGIFSPQACVTLVKLHVKHVEPLSFNLKQCGQMLA